MATANNRQFSAQRFNATCLKEISPYKEGETYDVYVDSVFSTRPFTPEERAEFKVPMPESAVKFIREDRQCIFNYSSSGEPGYKVFESAEGLRDYFKLVPSNK